MEDYVPFITGSKVAHLVAAHYSDAAAARIMLCQCDTLKSKLPQTIKLWVDAGIDGCGDIVKRGPHPATGRTSDWYDRVTGFSDYQAISTPSFWVKPDMAKVNSFVKCVMDACAAHSPAWITVPLLPFADDSSRNKINRALAKAAGKWKLESDFDGKLILPVILTHQRLINTNRRPRIELAAKCYTEAGAEGIWVVDSSLNDDSGSETLAAERFPNLIEFHQELNDAIDCQTRLAGPYWALNLVLWAKGLVDHPAIGVGTGYQYLVSGGSPFSPTARLAIPPLRRRAKTGADLRKWLTDVLGVIPAGDPSHAAISHLHRNYDLLSQEDRARTQVAQFYRDWFRSISQHPAAGRSLALFQDLSNAFVWGKTVLKGHELSAEGTARRPEAVAESLMRYCL